METWVLIITVLFKGAPVGVTSVPGFPDQVSCIAAGNEIGEIERLRVSDYGARIVCIHGPTKG
jgi:hypothetical protein